MYRCVVILLHLILLNLPQSWPDSSKTGVRCHILALFVVTDNSSRARVKSWPNFGEAHALI